MRKSVISRSRNGCAVCKSKRLKCDEAKPSCSRCKRLGITCPGYPRPLKWTGAPSSPHTRLPRDQPQRTKAASRPDPVDDASAATFDSEPPLASETFHPDLYDMDLFGEVAEMMGPGTSMMSDLACSTFESPFTFPAADQEPFGHATTPAAEPGNNAELWLDALLESRDVSNTGMDIVQLPWQDQNAPHQRQPTIAAHLQDRSSILVEYYFKEVCGMMSCYDSRMNPYRTTISNVWARSPSLYYIIQSMAAACLTEVSPDLGAAGRQLRGQASASLSAELSSSAASGEPISTSTLLAIVMHGFSLCWHDAAQVGQHEFDLLARAILSPESRQPSTEVTPMAEMQRKVFFYNSFVYWRMLLSFVTDRDLPTPAFPALHPQPQPASTHQSSSTASTSQAVTHGRTRPPHPQTGIGIHVLEILAEVGALVRRERRRIRSRQHASRADILASQAAMHAAEDLHAQLQGLDLPREASVMDSGDETTPVDHLLRVAEAYRCAGLLQLYRNFPDLLCAHQVVNDESETDIWLQTPAETAYSIAEVTREDSAPGQPSESPARGTLLTCMALHILNLLRDIPTSSRSRSIQPLLHVIVCSELSLKRRYAQQPPACLPVSFKALSIPTSPPSVADVLSARRSVLSRLATFETVLAAKPIRQMTRLVKETWAAMDAGRDEEVFWMDVMMDGGYETLMG